MFIFPSTKPVSLVIVLILIKLERNVLEAGILKINLYPPTRVVESPDFDAIRMLPISIAIGVVPLHQTL